MNIPNVLTSIRIILIPIIVIVYYLPVDWRYWVAALLFTIAAVTDWLDGYLARRLNQMTPFGAFFDPVADKITVSVALIVLAAAYGNIVMTVAALIIIGREILVSALREWMAEIGKRANVQVSSIGKFKTAFQMIAIILLLGTPPSFREPLAILGHVLMYAAVVLTIWSMVKYLVAAAPHLLPGKPDA